MWFKGARAVLKARVRASSFQMEGKKRAMAAERLSDLSEPDHDLNRDKSRPALS